MTAACCALFASSQGIWRGNVPTKDTGTLETQTGRRKRTRFKARERKANMQVKSMKAPPPPTMYDDGRLNNVQEVPDCPDTGADQDIMPMAMLDDLQVVPPDAVQSQFLRGPYANHADGPVKVTGKRRSYVVYDGDEFLVSDDTLKSIGIDIDRILEHMVQYAVNVNANGLESIVRRVDDDGDDLEEVGADCVELPQRSAVRAASLKAVTQVNPLKVTPRVDVFHVDANLLEVRFLKLLAEEFVEAGVIKSMQSAWCSPVKPVQTRWAQVIKAPRVYDILVSVEFTLLPQLLLITWGASLHLNFYRSHPWGTASIAHTQ
ncbi:hypothetical protein H257_09387 [Aphanomyces astaci]|uniref:Uncharacterized protein n=1 Tax=Aphanomyces astaci TaxID=112090 RepID=W4GCG8_APHAT|nr:hypothetical protein H257_09387 [Aphanomyces astaci]ETV76981.1 hypothetical protein H257_09387 [Aphanomyces astaci]|eukprot:XP_009833893.1 hypothetical protein H257_09387 [Aphanomyces astaci]